MVTPKAELDKAQWEETVKGLLARSVAATDLEMADDGGDTVYYSMTLAFPDGEQLRPSSKVTIKDGQVARLETVDQAAHAKIIKDSS